VHLFRVPRSSGYARLLRIVGVAAIVALAFGAGSIFTAMGTPAPVTYSACLAASNSRLPNSISGILPNGTLYNVTPNGTPRCQSGDTLVTWNQQGPMGATGAVGPAGTTGPSGPPGVVQDCDPAHLYPGVDLADCDLSGDDLSGANMTGANLIDSNLSITNLTGTIMTGANLTLASLNNANLTSAFLDDANLTRVNLSGATFSFTYMVNANLTDAFLENATFSDSTLSGVNMTGATLTGVTWSSTYCPDGTNSDDDGNTCIGHLTP
jgi:hypothetical protein